MNKMDLDEYMKDIEMRYYAGIARYNTARYTPHRPYASQTRTAFRSSPQPQDSLSLPALKRLEDALVEWYFEKLTGTCPTKREADDIAFDMKIVKRAFHLARRMIEEGEISPS